MKKFFEKVFAALVSLNKVLDLILIAGVIGAFVFFGKTYWLLFLLILLVLVIVHEFGHFIIAKWVNMRVDEFAFGFPPRLWSTKKGETTYAVNALPLGGYVAIWGENGEPNDEAKTHPRAFGNRPWWAQLLVLVAGVTMNMLLAWFVYIGISYGNIQMSANDEVYGSRVTDASLMVVNASPDSPAYKAGVVPGSTLVSVTSHKAVADLTTATSLVNFIGAHSDDPLTIVYKNNDGIISTTTVAAVYGIVPDKKAIGISVESVGTVRTTLWEAVVLGTERTYDMTALTLSGLGQLVHSVLAGKSVLEELSGPVGIARVVSQASEYGYTAVLTLVAVLSINLAIFNILPIPALDGGRMVVVIIEAVTKKKVPYKYYSWTNFVGFAALMLLLIVVTIHDVFK